MHGVLSGLRIIEHSAFVAAPLAGMSLAQLGAEVIRIDPIAGPLDADRWPVTASGKSLYWSGLNKGKKSILLDLASPEGQDVATRLVTGGDGILITNLGGRGWASYERLRKLRPDVIVGSLSGHPDGSAAVDYTVNCSTGLPFLNAGAAPDRPVNGVLPAWDISAGLTLAMGILAAERRRRDSGEGQLVTLALSDVAFAMMGTLGFIGEAQINGQVRGPDDNYVYGTFARDFGTRDGHRVMITSFTPRQWRALVDACGIGKPIAALEKAHGVDLGEHAARYALREEVSALVSAWVAARPLEQVRAAFDKAGVLWGPYQTYGQMATDDPRCSPQNPMFRRIQQPGIGEVTTPGTPLGFAGAERTGFVAPQPGDNTREVLTSLLKLSDSEVDGLFQRRIAGGA